jgi:hypothetical protein
MTAPFVISTKWDTCLEWITNWHYPELRGYFTLKSLLHSGLKQVMSLFTLGPPLCHLGQWLIFCWPNKKGWPWFQALLSSICRTYIFFTTSTELHIYLLNPSNGLFTASSDTLEYSKLVQHIFVWHVEIYIQYNRLLYEINKDTKFAYAHVSKCYLL